MKIVGIDSGKRVRPVVGVREAKQHGHKAAFPQETFLGILSASDVTSGFLDATNEEFEIIRQYQDLWCTISQRQLIADGRCLCQAMKKSPSVLEVYDR